MPKPDKRDFEAERLTSKERIRNGMWLHSVCSAEGNNLMNHYPWEHLRPGEREGWVAAAAFACLDGELWAAVTEANRPYTDEDYKKDNQIDSRYEAAIDVIDRKLKAVGLERRTTDETWPDKAMETYDS